MLQSYSPLLTDFYQLTMAYGYWKLNMHEQSAAFHLLFRKPPFGGNFALTCGLNSVLAFIQHWRFQEDDLTYLSTLKNSRGHPTFPPEFLDYLQNLTFTCDIDAIPEGTVVFPNEPLVRVQGPLLQCQLLETPLLNMINFQTLVATKAARVCRAAGDDAVIEFGMRRAQGPDGALAASRAAYIGGCVATSNTLAGKLFDIPVRGTHAHSWVTAFPSELQAFQAYAAVMPENCVFLVDTYNTIQGVENAIKVGNELRKEGYDLQGIRLDSGDMVSLSIQARELLDAAGFTQTGILASNSLDEYVIQDLKQHGAKINSWGVGTHLATAYDNPALDGVYKLSALQDKTGAWLYKLKLSEQEIKISNPGRHQVRRFFSHHQSIADVIFDLDFGITDRPETTLLDKNMQPIHLDDSDSFIDLLKPFLRVGKPVAAPETIHAIRARAIAEVQHFNKTQGNKIYSVGLEKKLTDLRLKLQNELKK